MHQDQQEHPSMPRRPCSVVMCREAGGGAPEAGAEQGLVVGLSRRRRGAATTAVCCSACRRVLGPRGCRLMARGRRGGLRPRRRLALRHTDADDVIALPGGCRVIADGYSQALSAAAARQRSATRPIANIMRRPTVERLQPLGREAPLTTRMLCPACGAAQGQRSGEWHTSVWGATGVAELWP